MDNPKAIKFYIKVVNKYGEFKSKIFDDSEFDNARESLMTDTTALRIPTDTGCMILKQSVLNESMFHFMFIE